MYSENRTLLDDGDDDKPKPTVLNFMILQEGKVVPLDTVDRSK